MPAGTLVLARSRHSNAANHHASRWEGIQIAERSLPTEVKALKRHKGGDLTAFGGVGLASSSVAEGLVDEYQFYVNPAVVGSGRSIFPIDFDLKPVESTAYRCGSVVSRYVPI